MHDPILIAAPTRCGTTMLAWLLHLHGVWIGEGKVTRAPETNPQVATENTAIKEYLKGVSGAPPDFRERIEAQVDTDGPWLVKAAQTLLKWKAWAEHFPEARWLCPVRSVDAITASRMRHPGMKGLGRAINRQSTVRHVKLQAEVMANARHVLALSADKLCGGGDDGEATARAAVEFCGLRFDPALYHGWVEPERWHNEKTLARSQRPDRQV